MSNPPTLPKSLRLAVQIPAPFSLSDYEPFASVGPGTYGIAMIADVTSVTVGEVTRACRKAAAAGATVGFCGVGKVKALFFDMDATVIVQESLVELAIRAGVGEHVAKVTERAMRGELDFRAALKERVALIRGLPASILPQVAESLTLMKGIQPLVAFCRELGVPAFMVSGGFMQLADVVARKVGFAGHLANVLGVKDGLLTGTVEGDIVDQETKRRFLLETCERLGILPAEVAAIGDGANDLPMLGTAGVAIGHQPKPVLLPHVHAVNASGNHAFLGPLLFGRDIGVLRSRLMQ